MPNHPPPRNGVGPSTLQLPPGPWTTVVDCLCGHFDAVGSDVWRGRLSRGLVLDANASPITETTLYRPGLRIHYYREVAHERCIPFAETILFADEHLVVADKPHFLPVTPAGGYVEETLLARLVRRFGNPDLTPLHRIDRATAGLVLFSVNPATRARYQALFPDRKIRKGYEALAPALPEREFPLVRESRLVRGEPFFRVREVDGAPNCETRIDVQQRDGAIWRYSLEPLTGRKHQLRVHMAALGAAIVNDDFYPALATTDVHQRPDYGFDKPLKLLARSLAFVDPVSGLERRFESRIVLD